MKNIFQILLNQPKKSVLLHPQKRAGRSPISPPILNIEYQIIKIINKQIKNTKMKREFTKLMAALMLLLFIAPLGMWGQSRETVTDHMTAENLAATSSTYTDFSVVSLTSDAVYAGQSAKDGSGNIQLRSKNSNSGIVSTTSGGTITSIVITVGSGSNTIDVYGSNTAYTSASDLYGNNAGTKIGSLSATGTITVEGSYAYVGVRSNSGAVYIESIDFVWTTGGTPPTPTCAAPVFDPAAGTYTEAQEVSITCTTAGAIIYYTIDGENPTTESDVYSTPLNIEETTTVKAMAVKQGMNNSGVVAAVYTIEAPAPTQTFSKIDGHNPVVGQTYLIVDINSGKALTSHNGTSSAPTAVAVTINNNQISTNDTELQWTFETVDGGYAIHPVSDNTKWLYSTNDNNGVRVGTNTNKAWELDITDATNTDYHGFKHVGTSRYIGVYNGSDWRAYTFVNNNIKNTNIALFVLGDAPTPTPSIVANAVNIPYDAISGQITFTINNPVEDATIVPEIASGATINDFVLGDEITSPLSFTCAANTDTEVRTATVTLKYMLDDEVLATKNVTVTQAAAPVIYSSIEAIFNAATSAETNVKVNFGGWVVTGVKGTQAFVSDGTNGLIIYQSNHGFVAGHILTGTVDCRLKLYYGAAKLLGVTNGMEGLTVETGGSVTPQVVTASQLTNGIKTGAVLTFENLAYDGSDFSDGNNTITVKTDLFDYSEDVEEGNSYNVTGVYEHSLRIYPRSETDIVEYVPVTVPALYNYSINGVEGQAIDATVGETITLISSANINDDYTFAGWTTNASNVNERLTGSYTLTEEVTTFYAVYAHTTEASSGTGEASYVKVTSTNDLEDGNYLIVSEDDEISVAFDGSLSTLDAGNNVIDVTVTDGVIASNETTDGAAFTIEAISETNYSIKNASGTYIGRANNSNGLDTSTEALVNTVSFDGGNAIIQGVGERYLRFNESAGTSNYRFRYYSSTYGRAIQLYKYTGGGTSGTTTYYTIVKFKEVAAYQGEKDGYVLVASPVSTTPEAAGMITDDNSDPENLTYDLYSFDQAEDLEWINYRQGGFNTIDPGKGYLYASKEGVTLTFAGVPSTTSSATLSLSGTGEFAGWNLVGNPFSVPAYIGTRAYYRIGNGGADIVAATAGTAIDVMEGIFVIATENNEVLNFSTTASKGASVAMNVVRERGNVIDRAIVRFDEGDQLPKFQLNPNNTKVYIPQGNKDYAVVRSAAEAEMPVSFRASENGTYTLAVEAENVEMNYLHLIDNLTGMDVDLLQTPSYTFEAKTSDYASRFRLVFKANGTNENNAETFAYFNGTNWTVSNVGNATLQVIDMMGRVLSSQTLKGNANISLNQVPGVYVLRLVSGNDVKVQKVVVR